MMPASISGPTTRTSTDSAANSTGAKWLINNLNNKCVDDTNWSTSNGELPNQNDCVIGWRECWFGL